MTDVLRRVANTRAEATQWAADMMTEIEANRKRIARLEAFAEWALLATTFDTSGSLALSRISEEARKALRT